MPAEAGRIAQGVVTLVAVLVIISLGTYTLASILTTGLQIAVLLMLYNNRFWFVIALALFLVGIPLRESTVLMQFADFAYECFVFPYVVAISGSVMTTLVATPYGYTAPRYNDLVLFIRNDLQDYVYDLQAILCVTRGASRLCVIRDPNTGLCTAYSSFADASDQAQNCTGYALWPLIIDPQTMRFSLDAVKLFLQATFQAVINIVPFPSEIYSWRSPWNTPASVPGTTIDLSFFGDVVDYAAEVTVCYLNMTASNMIVLWTGETIAADCLFCHWYHDDFGGVGCGFMDGWNFTDDLGLEFTDGVCASAPNAFIQPFDYFSLEYPITCVFPGPRGADHPRYRTDHRWNNDDRGSVGEQHRHRVR